MEIFHKTKVKYIILLLSGLFLAFSIYYFQDHVFEIGINPYSNLQSARMTGKEEFMLQVNEPSEVYLLHNAKLTEGYVEFVIKDEDGLVIDEYRLTEDQFINRSYNLEEGRYYCTITRDVKNNKEKIRFYYDKRFVTQEYINKEARSSG